MRYEYRRKDSWGIYKSKFWRTNSWRVKSSKTKRTKIGLAGAIKDGYCLCKTPLG